MEAIILAGGLGTRLRSQLKQLPKAMAPVGGRPFLEILMDQLVAAGCERVVLSVGYLRDIIIASFNDNYRGIPVSYSMEEEPLGTGGAIRLALRQATEASVLVLNGDTYLNADYRAALACHAEAGGVMTMAVTPVENTARYGGVVVEGDRITGFVEKERTGPGWINAGAYVLSQDFPWREGLPERFSFENDIIVPQLNELRPAAFRCRGYFLDIGVPEDLERAQTELAGLL